VFEPLGSSRPQQSDCRIVAATNVELRREVREGRFREDLFYRLNVINVVMPALKERGDDISLLATHFLLVHAARNNKPVEGFSPEALAAIQAYDWPGNVRELEHAVERAVVLGAGRTVGVEHLPEPVRSAAGRYQGPSGSAVVVPFGTPLEDAERMIIEETLRRTGGNKIRAASLLGISPRTIYRKQAPESPEIE
jgi:two-component system response regulator HydG